MFFGAPGLDVGLLGDLAGAGTRSPVLYRSRVVVRRLQQGRVDRSDHQFRRCARRNALLADMDGDGRDDLVLYRDGIWYVSATRDGVITSSVRFGAPGDMPV